MAKQFAKQFYHSKEWAETRAYILKRDHYLCIKCGEPAEEVHHIIHINPENVYDPSITMNPDNLASLCRACHFDEHREDRAKGHRRDDSLTEYEFDENGLLIVKK